MSNKKIELYGNTSQVMNDAIDRIVIEIYGKKQADKGAQKILLTGCGPRCGSTSTVIGLGISFASAKWKTLIVDCDIRKSNENKKLNENTNVGLSDYLLDEKKTDKLHFDNVVYPTNFDNLSYIPAGKYTANPARLFCSGMMKKFITFVSENYDFVLFDFPSISVTPDAQTLFDDVDGIILIAALEEVTKKQIRDAKQKVQPYMEKYYGMIVNKINLPLYKKYIKCFDYYFLDKKGYQKLGGKRNRKFVKQGSLFTQAIDEEEKKA